MISRRSMGGSGGVMLARVLVGLLLLAVAGRVGAQPAALVGQPVVALTLECAAPIDEDGLRRLLPLRVGSVLDATTLDVARRRLEETELFTRIDLVAEPGIDGVAVRVRLVRKVVLNALRFRGNQTLSGDELRRVVHLQEGSPLTAELRDYAVKRMRERYVDEGFADVQVSARAGTRGPGEADLTFRIREGEPLRIGAIAVGGGAPLPADEIRRASGLKVGARYVRSKVRAAEKNVLQFVRTKRYYEADVESAWTLGADKRGTLAFTVDLGPLYEVQFTGNQHFSAPQLLDLMDLPRRPIITDGTWRELARRARRAYRDDGYYFADLQLTVEDEPTKRVRFTVTEGQRLHVAEVAFEGNRGLTAAELRAPMATRPPSWIPWRRGVLRDDVFDDDLKRLWHLYRAHGFQAAEIVDARRRVDAEHGAIHLTVVVDEGPQTIVRAVELEGFEVVGERLPKPTVVVGMALNPEAVEHDRQALVTAVAAAGYAHAEVTAQTETAADGDTLAATVRFAAVPGEREEVGTIVVQNNFDTKARVITRELPFKPGRPLDPDALLRGQRNVYDLGLFRSVSVRPLDTTPPGPVHDIGVNVTEKAPGSLQWGAGYNTRDGFRGFMEVGYNNLQGLARRLSLRGDVSLDPSQPSQNEYLGDLGYREPRLFGSKWSLRADVIGQRSTRSVDQFSVERAAVVAALERSLVPGLKVGAEMQYEDANIFDVKPDVLAFNPDDEGTLQTISVGPYAVYEGRDDPFVPHRGVFDSLRFRWAPDALGSDVPLVKLVFQHSHYIPLSDDVTFIYAARGGWSRALESGQQVPIRERFFLGGRTTVRGFGENDVGPLGAPIIDQYGRVNFAGGNPLGGDMALNLNSEVRFPLAYGLGGATFIDGGGVYLQDRPVRIEDFRRSAGLGLRYTTPVGPLSLDYGFKLDRRSGESVGEVHFSIGTIF